MIENDVSFTAVKKQEKKEKAAVGRPAQGHQVRRLRGAGATSSTAAPTAGAAQADSRLAAEQRGRAASPSNAGNAPAELAKTTLEYAPDQADQARRLADIMGLSGSAMKPGKSVTNSQGLPAMTLTLGKDFKGAGRAAHRPDEGAGGRPEVHGGQGRVRQVN